MLDTDISSYIMNRSHASVLDKLRHTPISDVCISVISQAELQYGVEVSPHRQQEQAAVDAYLRHVEVLAYAGDAVQHYAQIRAVLKNGGNLIGGNDLLIAAHARSLGLTLVTNNIREFERVPGLLLENWVAGAGGGL